jgi:hypothetical protein
LQRAEKLKVAGIGNWLPYLPMENFQNKSLCWQRAQISEAPCSQVSFETEQFRGLKKIIAKKDLGLPATVSLWESAIRGKFSKEVG